MEMKWWPQVGSSLPVTSYTVGNNRQTYALRSLITFLLFISAYLMALSPHILANFGALETQRDKMLCPCLLVKSLQKMPLTKGLGIGFFSQRF